MNNHILKKIYPPDCFWHWVIFVICIQNIFSQIQIGNPNDNMYNNPSRMGLNMKYQSGSFVSELSPDDKGKIFYSDSWKEKVTINDSLHLKNVNYSLYDEALAYRISEDSIYLFDKEKISNFLIDFIRFERHYLDSSIGVTYLEVLYKSSSVALYKRHYMEFESKLETSDPLMVNDAAGIDIPLKKIEYFLSKNGLNPKSIKLNKKYILQEFKEEQAELRRYASTEKLSFRKELDVLQLLSYLEKNILTKTME